MPLGRSRSMAAIRIGLCAPQSSLAFEGLLCERFGSLNFAMALVVDGERLRLVLRRWSLMGIPMPLALAPRIDACEFVASGCFGFLVEIRHPLVGLIVRYRGWLARAPAA